MSRTRCRRPSGLALAETERNAGSGPCGGSEGEARGVEAAALGEGWGLERAAGEAEEGKGGGHCGGSEVRTRRRGVKGMGRIARVSRWPALLSI